MANRNEPISWPRLSQIGAVALGAAPGTAARWLIERAWPPGVGWPWATLTINITGAFVLGMLLEAVIRRRWHERVRLLVGTGFCGAYTTYSTLALESSLLVRAGHPMESAGYAVASVVIGIVAAWVGIVLAARMTPRNSTPPC